MYQRQHGILRHASHFGCDSAISSHSIFNKFFKAVRDYPLLKRVMEPTPPASAMLPISC